MVSQIFVPHFCTVMLSLSCSNCSTQSGSNYSMPSADPSIQLETMLISKKEKRPTHAISAEASKLVHIFARNMLKYFRGVRTY